MNTLPSAVTSPRAHGNSTPKRFRSLSRSPGRFGLGAGGGDQLAAGVDQLCGQEADVAAAGRQLEDRLARLGLQRLDHPVRDRQRAGLASTYLTRLKVGHRLVDATAVPYLYSGRVRPWHLLLVMLAGLVALATAIAVTPVGQEWADDVSAWLTDTIQGLFS